MTLKQAEANAREIRRRSLRTAAGHKVCMSDGRELHFFVRDMDDMVTLVRRWVGPTPGTPRHCWKPTRTVDWYSWHPHGWWEHEGRSEGVR